MHACFVMPTCRLCLVGSCPGGTASNVVTYLARADVTLSVLMTTASTLGAVVATPLLTKLLLGTLVPVDALALLVSTLQASGQPQPNTSTCNVGTYPIGASSGLLACCRAWGRTQAQDCKYR